MALIAAHLNAYWWWQCSDRYIISPTPHLHTPFPPFSPSLISRTDSVRHTVACSLKPHFQSRWPHLMNTHWGRKELVYLYAQSTTTVISGRNCLVKAHCASVVVWRNTPGFGRRYTCSETYCRCICLKVETKVLGSSRMSRVSLQLYVFWQEPNK